MDNFDFNTSNVKVLLLLFLRYFSSFENFNTSNVKVLLRHTRFIPFPLSNFNTSNVKVLQGNVVDNATINGFQYI